MRLIKLIFWVVVTVILAYFMTDIRIGQKTLKETIDGLIGTGLPGRVLRLSSDWVKKKIDSLTYEPPLQKQSPESGQKAGSEQITPTDEEELKKVIEKSR